MSVTQGVFLVPTFVDCYKRLMCRLHPRVREGKWPLSIINRTKKTKAAHLPLWATLLLPGGGAIRTTPKGNADDFRTSNWNVGLVWWGTPKLQLLPVSGQMMLHHGPRGLRWPLSLHNKASWKFKATLYPIGGLLSSIKHLTSLSQKVTLSL